MITTLQYSLQSIIDVIGIKSIILGQMREIQDYFGQVFKDHKKRERDKKRKGSCMCYLMNLSNLPLLVYF